MWKSGASLTAVLALGLGGCAVDYGSLEQGIDDNGIEKEDHEARCAAPAWDFTHPDPPRPDRPPALGWTAAQHAFNPTPWLRQVQEAYDQANRLATAGAPLTDADVDLLIAADELLEDAEDGVSELPRERDLNVLVGLNGLIDQLADSMPCVDEIAEEVAD